MHISPTPPAVYLSQSSTSTLPSGWASPQFFQRLWKPDDGARLHPSTKSTCVGKNHGRHYGILPKTSQGFWQLQSWLIIPYQSLSYFHTQVGIPNPTSNQGFDPSQVAPKRDAPGTQRRPPLLGVCAVMQAKAWIHPQRRVLPKMLISMDDKFFIPTCAPGKYSKVSKCRIKTNESQLYILERRGQTGMEKALFLFFNAWKPPKNIIKQLHPAEKKT